MDRLTFGLAPVADRLHEFIAGGTEEVQTAACILVGNMLTMHGKDVCKKVSGVHTAHRKLSAHSSPPPTAPAR